MKILADTLMIDELRQMATAGFRDMVKAGVNVERGVVALDAELHADLEAALIDDGSRQKDLWGINLYLEAAEDAFLQYDSMINIRPSQGNRTRGVDIPEIRLKIAEIVSQRIRR